MVILAGLEAFLGPLEAILAPLGVILVGLEAFLGPLGPILEPLGAVLGRSWGLLGRAWGSPEALITFDRGEAGATRDPPLPQAYS